MSVLYTGFNQIFNQISRHMQCIIEISNCVDIRMRQCLAKVLFRDEQERLDLLLGTECIKITALETGVWILLSTGAETASDRNSVTGATGV